MLERSEICEEEKTAKKEADFDTSSYQNIESELKTIFSTKVKVTSKKNKGKIEIEYYSNEDLDRLLGLIKGIEN